MKVWAQVAAGVFCLTVGLSCAKPDREAASSSEAPQTQETPVPPPEPAEPGIPIIKVTGNQSLIGTYCPFGIFTPPVSVPIGLYQCPIGRTSIELLEPLQPISMMVDCRKKTIDVRGAPHSYRASSWEFMPDGSFKFSIDGGPVKLKEDGAGNFNCSTPSRAVLRGKIDCTDLDRAKINVQTVWWLGVPFSEEFSMDPLRPSGSPAPTPSVSPTPGATPTSIPSGIPTLRPSPLATPLVAPVLTPVPNVSPSPQPTPSVSPTASPRPSAIWHLLREDLRPNPTPTPTPSVTESPVPMPSRTPTTPACQLPLTCYFHNITQVQQCR